MTKTTLKGLTSKWRLALTEYEKVREGKSQSFDSVDALCRAYQVSRKDIRKYYGRWIEAGKSDESLVPLKRGPKEGLYRQLTKEEERLLVNVKRRLQASSFETLELVKPYLSVPPSVRTVYRILKRYPLNERRKEAIKRYEKSYPGEMVHVDTKRLGKNFTMGKQKFSLLGLIDDCTRLAYVEVIERTTAAESTGASVRGLRWLRSHGVETEEIMTDNGGEFRAPTGRSVGSDHFFGAMLKMFGVRHRLTKPYRPQTNGKIERFWRTLNEECLSRIQGDPNEQILKTEINRFMQRYNYQRRHGGIKYQTPFEKLTNIANLLPKL